jgi:hypothetical protein
MKILLRSTIGLIAIILVVDALLLIVRGVLLTYEAIHNLLMRPELARPCSPASRPSTCSSWPSPS